MSPGTYVQVKNDWTPVYRKPGAEIRGFVVTTSPTGLISRVRMDGLGDSYLCTAHLEPVSLSTPA